MSHSPRARWRCVGVVALSLVVAGIAATPSPVVVAQGDAPVVPAIMPLERALRLIEAAERSLDYVPGEVIVRFKDGVSTSGQQRALDGVRSRPETSDLRTLGDAFVLRDRDEWDATVVAAQLARQPEVAFAEPNYLRRMHRTPNDPEFGARQWNFSALDLTGAWDINNGGTENVIVAVLDTGITTVNQTINYRTWTGTAIQTIAVPFRINADLAGPRLVSPRDFVNGGNVVLDMDGHGTHVSATIGQDTNNSLGYAGVAYAARIMPVKVCQGYWDVQFAMSAAGVRGSPPLDVGGCDTASVIAGIRYAADNGARVINLSVGGPTASAAERDALAYAVGRGVFVAVAMGNEFERGNPADYPAVYAPALDGLMAVGAVGRALRRAYYSSTGSHIEIVAPGGDAREGINAEIWQTALDESSFDPRRVIFPRFDLYVGTPMQGTSMAAPHVAGIAALLMSQGVTNPAAVEALIKQTARSLGTPSVNRAGWNADYGYGLIQPRTALRGFGLAR